MGGHCGNSQAALGVPLTGSTMACGDGCSSAGGGCGVLALVLGWVKSRALCVAAWQATMVGQAACVVDQQ
jgi:hypothetical protein